MGLKFLLLIAAFSPFGVIAQSNPPVNGANLHYALCGGKPQFGSVQYADIGGGVWGYLDHNFAYGTARIKGRDEWSVYLVDDQGADVQVDLFKKTCTWSKQSNTRSYLVMNAGHL